MLPHKSLFHRRALSALCLLAFFAGCDDGERHIAWERPRSILGPILLKDRVAYVDTALDRVVIVDASESSPRIQTHAIGRRAVYATSTPDRRSLAIITGGEEAVIAGQIDEDPRLWLINTSEPDSVPVSYAVGSPFDRLAISADGHWAVAYFSAAGPNADGFFRNPNELAVIDLFRSESAEEAEANPVLKTIRSFGSIPDGVVVSPPMVVPGAEDQNPRIFAFVLAQNNLTILDVTHAKRKEVTVRLDLAGTQVRPRELVFAPEFAAVYLRSDNARDVLELLIYPDPPNEEDPDDNDYRPVLAELGAGGGPADIAVYDDAGGRRLILAATPNTREVVIIDTDTARFTTVATPDPIDRVLLFPDDPQAVPRVALLASLSLRLPRIHLLDLNQVTDDLLPPALVTVDLQMPVLDVVPVPGRELGMVIHDDDRTVLGLLDIAFGSVAPLQGVGRLDSYAFSTDGRYLVGATQGQERLGFLELDNLHPSDLRLDHAAHRVLTLSGGAIFVDHGDPMGRATIIPSPTASRQEATVLNGFLLAGMLKEEF